MNWHLPGTPDLDNRRMPSRRPRLAVLGLFFANGVGWASWASRLPTIREQLELSEGALGLALLGATVGLFVATALTSLLVIRFGSRAVAIGAGVAMSAVLPFIGLAPGFLSFATALICYGVTNGALDLASNAQAADVERRVARPMMSGFHALFSAGAIAGAGSAAALAALDVPVEVHLSAVGAVLALAFLAACPALLADLPHDPAARARALALPPAPLLALGALAFCVLLAEGAIFDWSAIYMNSVAHANLAMSAIGLAVFQGAMMLGRLRGDWAAVRLGPRLVVSGGAALGVAGLLLALLVPTVLTSLAGLFLLGLGLAAAFPLTLSRAARMPGVPTPTALAATTAAGYTGFMAGPPLIGFIAELTNLRVGLGVVVVCLVLAVALAGRLGGTAPA